MLLKGSTFCGSQGPNVALKKMVTKRSPPGNSFHGVRSSHHHPPLFLLSRSSRPDHVQFINQRSKSGRERRREEQQQERHSARDGGKGVVESLKMGKREEGGRKIG